jgi:hypothetical protein
MAETRSGSVYESPAPQGDAQAIKLSICLIAPFDREYPKFSVQDFKYHAVIPNAEAIEV